MTTFIHSDPRKGRGVYADKKFSKGELIEKCHLIIINFEEIADSLEGYVFEFSTRQVALALGNGSLFNHHDRPNADFIIDKKNRMLVVKAVKTIAPGEEITINYRYNKADKKKFNIS